MSSLLFAPTQFAHVYAVMFHIVRCEFWFWLAKHFFRTYQELCCPLSCLLNLILWFIFCQVAANWAEHSLPMCGCVILIPWITSHFGVILQISVNPHSVSCTCSACCEQTWGMPYLLILLSAVMTWKLLVIFFLIKVIKSSTLRDMVAF
jgi:hypothetical protein